jgi:hypothetical protein
VINNYLVISQKVKNLTIIILRFNEFCFLLMIKQTTTYSVENPGPGMGQAENENLGPGMVQAENENLGPGMGQAENVEGLNIYTCKISSWRDFLIWQQYNPECI